ncbi:hypothetical protein VDGL01_12042 [Verticillium dahliae]
MSFPTPYLFYCLRTTCGRPLHSSLYQALKLSLPLRTDGLF